MAFLEFTRSDDGVKLAINDAMIISAVPFAGTTSSGTVLHVIGISPSIIVAEDYATVLAMLAGKPGGPDLAKIAEASGIAGGQGTTA